MKRFSGRAAMLLAGGLLALGGGLSLGPAPEALAQENDFQKRVDGAVKKGAEFLLSKQQKSLRIFMGDMGANVVDVDAEWKDVVIVKGTRTVKVKGKEYNDVYFVLPPGWFEPEPTSKEGHISVNVGGQTALATTALLAAGLNPQTDKRVLKAVEATLYCYSAQTAKDAKEPVLLPGMVGTYAVGMRATALEYAMRSLRTGEINGHLRRNLQHDGDQLSESYAATGGYTYKCAPNTGGWDLSNTQYGVLGLWACARANIELSEKVWRHFNNFLLDIQSRDGGWPYSGNGTATPTMTAAGIASVFVLLDYLHTRTRGANKPDISPFSNDPLLLRTVQGIDRGLEYWGKIYKPTNDGYYMYGAERIGVASGYKYFGTHDWFREGSEVVLRAQGSNGAWNTGHGGAVCQTGWHMMFLVFGGAPVLVNKLQYGAKGDWQWHNYPRDAANVATWYNRTYETLVNWQIIDLQPNREEDLMDAPILYINGYKEFTLKDDEVDMLRRYVEKGGTLLFIASGGQKAFISSIVKLGERLYSPEKFPEYAFTALPKTHPVYTMQAGRQGDPIMKMPIWHMNNGHRSFAFLVPEDINHLWHGNKSMTRPEAFKLIANIRNYATERSPSLPGKIRPPITSGEAKGSVGTGSIKLGVVSYTSKGVVKLQKTPGREPAEPVAVKSDWATAPLTWRIYNEWFRHVTGFDIQEVRGVSLTDPELKSYDVIHLSGHYAFTLTDEEKNALKEYVNGGGCVLVDPVGGVNNEFYQSALETFRKLFPEKVELLGRNSPIISGAGAAGRDLSEAEFSRNVKITRPELRSPSEVVRAVTVNGKVSVLISPFDLSLGLAGQTCWDRMGFSGKTSRGLVANFLVLAKNNKGAPVAAGGGN